MKRVFGTCILLFFAINLFAQAPRLIKDDKVFPDAYNKTNFNKIDTLALWHYKFEGTNKKTPNSPVPVGLLTFWRIRPLYDTLYEKIYHHGWSPSISYFVFNLSDSDYCKKTSLRIRMLASCRPPAVGGDYFILGKYIFLNEQVCLECQQYDTGADFCRPVINFIISKIDERKAATLDDIFKQFVIRKG